MTDTDTFVQIGAAAQRVVDGIRPAREGVETWQVTDRAAIVGRFPDGCCVMRRAISRSRSIDTICGAPHRRGVG